MNIYLLMKLLHVLAAFWMIAGVVGWDFTFWQAGRATSVQAVQELLKVSEIFERWAVIPVSVLVLVFGLVVTWMQKWPLFGFLQGAASNWLLVSFILFIGISAVIAPLRLVDRRRRRTRALEEALSLGTVTPELTASLHDKAVNRFRKVELTLLVIIIVLTASIPGSGKTLFIGAPCPEFRLRCCHSSHSSGTYPTLRILNNCVRFTGPILRSLFPQYLINARLGFAWAVAVVIER